MFLQEQICQFYSMGSVTSNTFEIIKLAYANKKTMTVPDTPSTRWESGILIVKYNAQ